MYKMKNQLSQYAEEQFVKFLKNKAIQTSIGDMIVYMNIMNFDDVIEVCITMFLANVDVSKLHPDDLEILKYTIRNIRSMDIQYPLNTDVYPEPTYDFIKSKLEERFKAGFSAGYKKVIDLETGTVRIPL